MLSADKIYSLAHNARMRFPAETMEQRCELFLDTNFSTFNFTNCDTICALILWLFLAAPSNFSRNLLCHSIHCWKLYSLFFRYFSSSRYRCKFELRLWFDYDSRLFSLCSMYFVWRWLVWHDTFPLLSIEQWHWLRKRCVWRMQDTVMDKSTSTLHMHRHIHIWMHGDSNINKNEWKLCHVLLCW